MSESVGGQWQKLSYADQLSPEIRKKFPQYDSSSTHRGEFLRDFYNLTFERRRTTQGRKHEQEWTGQVSTDGRQQQTVTEITEPPEAGFLSHKRPVIFICQSVWGLPKTRIVESFVFLRNSRPIVRHRQRGARHGSG